MSYPLIMTDTEITITFDDGPATVLAGQPNFEPLIDAVREGDWEHAYELSRPVVAVQKSFADQEGRVSIEAGVVQLDGEQMHGVLVDRMVDMLNNDFDINYLVAFMKNLDENPDPRAVSELYGFLEVSRLPITPDGHFLAYKRVRDDYMDIYTGKMDNSVGQVVTMKRHQVNSDKNQTCSTGLHFCAREYLASYGTHAGNATMVVKINPRDVVSIPVDYNNAKGRCCRYEVIDELVHSDEEKLELGIVDFRGWDEPEIDDFEEVESSTLDVAADDIVFSSRQKLRDFLHRSTDYKFWDRGHNTTERWVARYVGVDL